MKQIDRETENELRVLYERYASMVHRRCRLLLKSEDDAWDATQEVFMKLARSLDTIRKRESVYSWLLSAGTNYCISQLRKRKHDSFDEEIHRDGRTADMLPQERRMLLDELQRHFLAPWDKKTRAVVIYTYIDGYRQDEIARLTGMGESTVRRHLTRFRRAASQSALVREDLV